jgi:DNA-directed RNA polymerase subunit beta'
VSLNRDGEVLTLTITDSRIVADEYPRPEGYLLRVEDGATVKAGEALAVGGDHSITAQHAGVVEVNETGLVVRYEVRESQDYLVPASARLWVRDGDQVKAGDQLTDGSQNPHRILTILGAEAAQSYLLDEIQRVYRSQGVTIDDKHIEIIVRQMLAKVRILRPGNTSLLPADLIDKAAIEDINAAVVAEGGRPATFQPLLMGITKASLETESVLSAASFQHTINILARAAIEGKTDRLVGLKENVILGKLIPAGTGFRRRQALPDEDLARPAEDAGLDLSEEVLAELLEDDLDLDRFVFVGDVDDDVAAVADPGLGVVATGDEEEDEEEEEEDLFDAEDETEEDEEERPIDELDLDFDEDADLDHATYDED